MCSFTYKLLLFVTLQAIALSLSAISPQMLSQIEKNISHVYGHILTTTIVDFQTFPSTYFALMADHFSIPMLTAIAKMYFLVLDLILFRNHVYALD